MEAFLYLLFMVFVSFAVGTIVWVLVSKFFGRGTTNAKIFNFILIPICVLGMDFLIILSGRWGYLVGAIPLFLIAGYCLYYRFGHSGAYFDAPEPGDFKRAESKNRAASAKPAKNGISSTNTIRKKKDRNKSILQFTHSMYKAAWPANRNADRRGKSERRCPVCLRKSWFL